MFELTTLYGTYLSTYLKANRRYFKNNYSQSPEEDFKTTKYKQKTFFIIIRLAENIIQVVTGFQVYFTQTKVYVINMQMLLKRSPFCDYLRLCSESLPHLHEARIAVFYYFFTATTVTMIFILLRMRGIVFYPSNNFHADRYLLKSSH